MAESPAIVNPDQHRILAAYAKGSDVEAIIGATGLTRDYIGGVLSKLCSFDRGRAREMVRAYEQRQVVAPAASAPPSMPTPPTVVVPAPAPAGRGRIEQLLAYADRSDLRKAKVLAEKIRQLVDELAAILERAEAEQEARELVATKRRELDEAEAKLRAVNGLPARRTHTAVNGTTTVSNSTIRSWATSAGVECAPSGKLPRRVVEAYYLAHPQAPR